MEYARVMMTIIVMLFAAIEPGIAQGAQETGSEGLDVYRDPDRLRELIENPPAVFLLVDVRAKAEYLVGHIPGAIHVPYDEIAANPPTDDTDALIILYCQSGVRSGRAERSLRSMGYTRVLDWGGIVDWPYQRVTGPDPHG